MYDRWSEEYEKHLFFRWFSSRRLKLRTTLPGAASRYIRSHELRELFFSIAAVAAVLPFYFEKKSASIYGLEPLGRVSSGGGLGGEAATNRRGNDRSIMRVRTLAQERRA